MTLEVRRIFTQIPAVDRWLRYSNGSPGTFPSQFSLRGVQATRRSESREAPRRLGEDYWKIRHW